MHSPNHEFIKIISIAFIQLNERINWRQKERKMNITEKNKEKHRI